MGLTETPYAAVSLVALGFRSPEDQYQNAQKSRFDEAEIIQMINSIA